jgi:hypothetical protein
LVDRDKVDFVVGPVFSNILIAMMKPVTEGGAILISPNAGTSNFAGKECNANFFVTSYQNDQNHEVMGKYAQDAGMKKVFLMAPNYQAGKDSIAGFKRYFKGEIADELFVPLGQLDYSAELTKIAAASPDAIFVFLPGGMGVNFVKQFRQAGLADKVKFLSAFTVDESTLPAQKEAAVGFFGGANWAPNLDNPQNKKFVADYEKEYNAVPATYAFQAYDAALLIDGALKLTKGNTSDKDALRAALAGPVEGRRDAVSDVCARWPRFLDAWARLAQLARDDVVGFRGSGAGTDDGGAEGAGEGTGAVATTSESLIGTASIVTSAAMTSRSSWISGRPGAAHVAPWPPPSSRPRRNWRRESASPSSTAMKRRTSPRASAFAGSRRLSHFATGAKWRASRARCSCPPC